MECVRESPINPVSAAWLIGGLMAAGIAAIRSGVDPQDVHEFFKKQAVKDLERQYERKLRAQALRRRRHWRQGDLPALVELLLEGHAKPATQRLLRKLSKTKGLPGPRAIPPPKSFDQAMQDALKVEWRLIDPATSASERRKLHMENMPKIPDLVEAAYRGELATIKRRLRFDRASPHHKASDLAKQRVADATGLSSAKVHGLCQQVRDERKRLRKECKLRDERGLRHHGFADEPAMTAADLKAFLNGQGATADAAELDKPPDQK